MKTGMTQAHIHGQTLGEVCKILPIKSTWNNRTNGTAVFFFGREGEGGKGRKGVLNFPTA